MRSDQNFRVSTCTGRPRKRLALRIADMRFPSVLPCNCICASHLVRLATSGSWDKAPARTVLLPCRITLQESRFQLAPDLRSSIDAHADQPGPAGRDLANAGNADLLRFVHVHRVALEVLLRWASVPPHDPLLQVRRLRADRGRVAVPRGTGLWVTPRSPRTTR